MKIHHISTDLSSYFCLPCTVQCVNNYLHSHLSSQPQSHSQSHALENFSLAATHASHPSIHPSINVFTHSRFIFSHRSALWICIHTTCIHSPYSIHRPYIYHISIHCSWIHRQIHARTHGYILHTLFIHVHIHRPSIRASNTYVLIYYHVSINNIDAGQLYIDPHLYPHVMHASFTHAPYTPILFMFPATIHVFTHPFNTHTSIHESIHHLWYPSSMPCMHSWFVHESCNYSRHLHVCR